MAAANLQAVLTALANHVRSTVPGIHVSDHVPAAPVPPAVVMMPSRINPHWTLGSIGGSARTAYEIDVTVLVSFAATRDAQVALANWVAVDGVTTTLLEAMESNNTLGGVVAGIRVLEVRDFGTVEFGATSYLSATVAVEVIA